MTGGELLKIMPYSGAKAEKYAPYLTAAMAEFAINTPERQAAFIAQVGHESGQLRYVRELASGEAYEGRKDLGNTQPGDGVRFKGRGLIQITGRANYAECGKALGLDLIAKPELLEEAENACRSAAWFWHSRKLNQFADQGMSGFGTITRRINGGTNGMSDRLALYRKAQEVFA
jgi:putative chitinase